MSPLVRARLVDLLYGAATGMVVVFSRPIAPAPIQLLLFLLLAILFLQRFGIPQRVGHLSLTLLAVQAAALVLSPQQAIFVGIASALLHLTRPETRTTTASAVFRPAFGAAIRSWLITRTSLPFLVDAALVIIAVTAQNLLGTALVASIYTRQGIISIYRRVFSRAFGLAFLYFALGSYLLATVVSATVSGFISGGLVVVLSVAVAVMLGEQRAREALEAERLEHQRHATTARVVDGLLHNLRNRVALLRYSIDELENARSPIERRDATTKIRQAVEEAASAIGSVEESLKTTSGAHPRPADIGALVSEVAASYQGMARTKAIRLVTRFGKAPLEAPIDTPMIRDVIGNLIKNAIEASPEHGEVRIGVSRTKDRVVITVADDGPGIPDELKDRLFEPHFTTKSEGTGLGLFTSYGIIREHRGRLLYQPNPKAGAIFTIELPFGKQQLEPQARPFGASGLQDQSASV